MADERASAAGGIQKWTKSGSVWSLAYTLDSGASNIGARAVTVDFSGANPVIYAISAENTANRLFKITDTGSGTLVTTLAIAPTGTVFRGVDFAPVLPPAEIALYDGANDQAPALTDDQVTAVNFGSTPLGTPVTRHFTVKNLGGVDLHLTGLTLPAGYARVGTFAPVTVAAGSTYTFQVRFLANSVKGVFAGAFALANDDADEGVFDLSLTARSLFGGNPAALDLSFNGTGKATAAIGSRAAWSECAGADPDAGGPLRRLVGQ